MGLLLDEILKTNRLLKTFRNHQEIKEARCESLLNNIIHHMEWLTKELSAQDNIRKTENGCTE